MSDTTKKGTLAGVADVIRAMGESFGVLAFVAVMSVVLMCFTVFDHVALDGATRHALVDLWNAIVGTTIDGR